MTSLFPAIAVASAAFCVWLTVRIVNRREKWAKWALAAMAGVPLMYVASFGPLCWVLAIPADEFRQRLNERQRDGLISDLPNRLAYFYWPLGRMISESRPGKPSVIERYARLWLPRDQVIVIPAAWSGNHIISTSSD